ncbi:unnamed protein product [Blepharisma stoltei]|uniref:PHD-type domain-containing protein n=1 Tax=Blepharisma stoltei TaxID=1481888 RepID=A0AAU9JXL6_9CILI|nr:unnamed protein product [Blepharisma stoltei]
MRPSFAQFSSYPYNGFLPETQDSAPSNFFHLDCPDTGLSICYCKKYNLNIVHTLALKAQNYDPSSAYKKRQFDKEHFQAIPVISPPPSISAADLNAKICSYCAKVVCFYQKVNTGTQTLHLCRDCYKAEDTNVKKSLSLSARKKKFGKLLMLGTTQTELGRRGRPRIHGREENDYIQCYFPICKRRNIRFPGDPDLLTCGSCTRTFHAKCAEPPLRAEYVKRFPWLCLECKVCSICGKLKDESHLMICDACDRVFHAKCIKINGSGSFVCKDCSVCRGCEKVLPSPLLVDDPIFVEGYRFCLECYGKVQEKCYCPICVKIYSVDSPDAFVMCDKCQLWVHAACEKVKEDQIEHLQGKSFTCSKCSKK